MKKENDIKLGVSLYSYQDNYYFHRHDLEGCLLLQPEPEHRVLKYSQMQ